MSGAYALLAALLLVATPTAVRAYLQPIVSAGVFLTYVPFVMLGAMLLSARQAIAVALACSLVADYFFMVPFFALAVAPNDLFSVAMLLLITIVCTAVVKAARSDPQPRQPATSKHQPGPVIFSETKGEAWAHWQGSQAPVKLGPHKDVAKMMQDYIAQVELGERLTRNKRKNRKCSAVCPKGYP